MRVFGMRRCSLCYSLRFALGMGSWHRKSAPVVSSWGPMSYNSGICTAETRSRVHSSEA